MFDRFCATLLSRYGDEAQRGAIFIDPYAKGPYLFHLAQVSVVRQQPSPTAEGLFADPAERHDWNRSEVVAESRLVGLRQEG